MKTLVLTLATILGISTLGYSQKKSSIAIANPAVTVLHATPEITSKLIRLEIVKLDQYSVYDEYDMQEAYSSDSKLSTNCLSKACLVKLGTKLGVDYIVSGSYDALGNKIVISLKIIDVANDAIYKSAVREFDNHEVELQRMTEIVLKEMHGVPVEKELVERLKFNNELITSNNVGKVKNNGPRIGFAVLTGSINEFATRSASLGGLDITPVVSTIGYQLEQQYVGTEKFSALVEGIFNISGMEQGKFLPSLSILNGFRFGKASWEFAFGPGFNLAPISQGFIDTEGLFGETNRFYNSQDWREYTEETYGAGAVVDIEDVSDYEFKDMLDKRGDIKFGAQFIIAAGRTFRAGSLNVPVNVFYSNKGKGGMVGLNVGFNVMQTKKPINSRN